MTERSIIVKDTSVEQALAKGLLLLGAERGEVTYEVLQEGARPRNGLPGTPYKLRVSVGGSAPPPDSEDNMVSLPTFTSHVPEMEAEELEGLSSAEFLALLERVEASVARVVPAAEVDAGGVEEESAVIDGDVFVEVATNRMEAFVTITPAHGGGREVTTADVSAALAASGVRYGVAAGALADAVLRRATRHLVATGLRPQAGADAQIRFMTEEGALTEEVPTGREVHPGMVVAVKAAPLEGASGVNVLGQALPAHLGRDISLHIRRGKNLRVSADGRELIAVTNGIVSVIDDKILVENALQFDRDITSAVGNIDFVGARHAGSP